MESENIRAVPPADKENYINVFGRGLFYKVYGSGQETLLCLHGGPGVPHDYTLSMADMAQSGYRVIFYDQLGVGKSELPKNRALFTVERYVEELEEFRKQLGLDKKFHLWGSSWGGFLAIAYALKYQENLKSLISAGGGSNTLLVYDEMLRLKSEMPSEIREVFLKYEDEGDYENSEYLKAIDVLYRKHFCRISVWPKEVSFAIDHVSKPVYHTMRGPNEFTLLGNLMYWDVTPKLGAIMTPTLLTCGRYDEVTPKVQKVLREGIPGSELEIFERGSHLTFWEERGKYMKCMTDFLNRIS